MDVVFIISNVNKSLNMEWVAAGLKEKGVKQFYILLQNKPESELMTFLATNHIEYRYFHLAGKKDYPKLLLKIWTLLRELNPKTVHCHLIDACLIGLTAAKLAAIKQRIYTRHHSSYHHEYHAGAVKWDKLCNKLSTDIISISDTVTNVLEKLENVPKEKITRIEHGFDLKLFSEADPKEIHQLREKYNPSGRGPVIGVISRWVEWKGVQYIIPAFKLFLEKYPAAKLLLFNAEGSYKAILLDHLKQVPKDSFEFIAFENNLPALYHTFDIFVHTPIDDHSEAFGQVYIESLAAGIPSVFSLSGIANTIMKDRENALIVGHKDVSSIFTAMCELCCSPALRNTLIQNGKKTASFFTIDRQVNELYSLYKRIK